MSDDLVEELLEKLEKAEEELREVKAEREELAEYVKNVKPYLTRWLHHMEEVLEATDDGAVFWDLEEARKIIEARK